LGSDRAERLRQAAQAFGGAGGVAGEADAEAVGALEEAAGGEADLVVVAQPVAEGLRVGADQAREQSGAEGWQG
jgi:hypothetical protein